MELNKTFALETAFVAVGTVVLILNFLVFPSILGGFVFLLPLFNIIGALVAILPPFLIFYGRYQEKKDIEEQFIIFVNDLTESIDSGMTLPIALRHTSKKDYRSLTPYVREIHSKVDWGIPFEKALQLFSEKIDSTPIKRSVGTIIETYKVGGKISDTLRAIGQSLVEISKIKQERSASVQSQIVTSYLIFFVFIFILVVLKTFLIPAIQTMETPEGAQIGGTTGVTVPVELYAQTFVNFIIVQGFFAGLATGKMAEGSAVAGLKHSIVLIVIGYTIFSLLGQFNVALF